MTCANCIHFMRCNRLGALLRDKSFEQAEDNCECFEPREERQTTICNLEVTTSESHYRRGRKKPEKEVESIIQIGDTVYSAANGKSMTVLSKDADGFETEDDYFRYDEHRKLFWLTLHGYETNGGK